MSLPPALLARLAQRGLVNKQKAQKENGKNVEILPKSPKTFIKIYIPHVARTCRLKYNCRK